MKKNLRIRHYVMGVISHACNRSVKLPSLRELEKSLDSSRGTLVTAFNELIKEGYLTAKNGVGYFTLPQKMALPFSGSAPRMICILVHGGRNFYFGENLFYMGPPLLAGMRGHNFRIHYHLLEGETEEAQLQELSAVSCDALYWDDPPQKFLPVLEKLAKSGIAVLINYGRKCALNRVFIDLSDMYRQIGSSIAALGWKHLLYCSADASPWLPEVGAAAKALGQEFQCRWFDTGRLDAAALEAELTEFSGDAVICDPRSELFVRNFMNRNGRNIPVLSPLQYVGEEGGIYTYLPDFAGFGNGVSERLEELLAGDTSIRDIGFGGVFEKQLKNIYFPF